MLNSKNKTDSMHVIFCSSRSTSDTISTPCIQAALIHELEHVEEKYFIPH